jgi:hypothetical protein
MAESPNRRQRAYCGRAGWTALLVLEDMPPRWRDLGADLLWRRPLRQASLVFHKLRAPLPTVASAAGHVRLREGQLRAWTSRLFQITQRHWANSP